MKTIINIQSQPVGISYLTKENKWKQVIIPPQGSIKIEDAFVDGNRTIETLRQKGIVRVR